MLIHRKRESRVTPLFRKSLVSRPRVIDGVTWADQRSKGILYYYFTWRDVLAMMLHRSDGLS